MTNLEIINALPQNTKEYLLSYIESLPRDLKTAITLNLFNGYLNPNNQVGGYNLHIYSTLRKFFNSAMYKTTITNDPSQSTYQAKYCEIISLIERPSNEHGYRKLLSNHMIAAMLKSIINSECYKIENLIDMELKIVDMYKKLTDESDIRALTHLLNVYVLPYQFSAYDLYTQVIMMGMFNDVDNNSRDTTYYYSHFAGIQDKIYRVAKFDLQSKNNPIVGCHTIASYIHFYFNKLGIESCIEKYELMTRFKYLIKYFNEIHADEYVEDIYSTISNFRITNTTQLDIIHNLIFYDPRTVDEYNTIDVESSDVIEQDGFVFLSSNLDVFINDIDSIAHNLQAFNINEILKYIPDTDIGMVNTTLSENDYGHISALTNKGIMIAYSSIDYKSYEIGKYDGIYYVLFKIRNLPSKIFGLSLSYSDDNKSRYLLDFKESSRYHYQYISPI